MSIEQDITEFFEAIETQGRGDSKKTLRLLLERYIHANKVDHLMDSYDLNKIVGRAKTLFAELPMPMFIGRRSVKVSQSDQKHVCMIEATIAYINKLKCLKRIPKFDYQDDKF